MSLFSAKLASLFVDIVVNSRRANTVLYQFNNNVKRSGAQVSAFRQQLLLLGLASSAILLVMKAAHLLNSAFQAVLETSVRLEKNFLEVQKNLQLSADGFASLQQETLTFATNVAGINIEKFQQILIASSRMGLQGKEDLLEFSKAVAIVQQVSEGIGETELAEFLYRVTELFHRSTDSAIYLGNTLVTLSNAFATNEQQIIKVTEKLMGSAEVLGLTAEETLAVAAAVRSMGITTERASSGMARVFQILSSSPLNVGRILFKGNEQAAIDFAYTVENEPTKALEIFFLKLKQISDSGQDLQSVLKELDLEDRRVAETIKIIFNRLSDLKKGFDLAGDSANNTESLMKKFNIINESMSAKLERLTANWEAFKNSLSNTEAFKVVIDELAGMLMWLTKLQNSGALKIFIPFLNSLDRTAAELKIIHEMFGNWDITPEKPDTGRGTSAGGDASGDWGEDASRTDEQLKEEQLERERKQEETVSELNKKLAQDKAQLIEDEYKRRLKLAELEFYDEEQKIAELHDQGLINLEEWHRLQLEYAEMYAQRVKQIEEERDTKAEEERLKKLKEFKDMFDEIISLEKEWMRLREEQNIENTEDTLLQKLLEIEAQYKRNIERIKELEAERAKAENRPINNAEINAAIADEQRIKERKSKKVLEDAEKDFRQGLGEFVLSDAEQQAEAIKEKFAELKRQAAELGAAQLFPALDQQMNIELGQINKPEARLSGLQDVWKNAQLEFLKTPKEEIAILKDIAQGQDEIVDAINAQNPVAAVGP